MGEDRVAKRAKKNGDDAPALSVEDDEKIRSFLASIEKGAEKGRPASTSPPSADAAGVPPEPDEASPSSKKPPPPAAASGPPKPPPPLFFDVVRREPAAGDAPELLGRLDLSGASQLTFGRDPSRVDVVLDHGSISRHHATLTFDGDAAFLSDIRSTHGTFVAQRGAERRLSPKDLVQLEPGDVVRFGESSRRYVFGRARPGPRHVAAPAKDMAHGLARQYPPPPVPDATPGVVSLGNGEVKIELRVPAGDIGRVIGRGGATIAAVQEQTGAGVTVAGREAEDHGGFRTVYIKGRMDAVAAARLELLTLINAADQRPAPSSSSSSSAPATTERGGGADVGFDRRFRYSSTVVNTREDDGL